MMTIDDFLTKFVEGYLFHDLENMSNLKVLPAQVDGAAGYPIVATVMAGIELLGNLLTPNISSFDPVKESYNYFINLF
jgi:hypothetical protein